MTHAILGAVDWSIFWQRIFNPGDVFLSAMGTTVYIAVTAQIIGVVLGLVAAFMRMSRFWPIRLLSGIYVLIFRGTPALVQIYFIYFGVNILFGFALIPTTVSFGLFNMSGAIFGGIVALGLNEGAYMREIIRAGIDSIDRGQMEAAKSLGMPHRLAMRRIVLPQAARVIVPPLGNDFTNMIKSTSLLFTIGVYEMFADAEIHYGLTFKPVEYFGAVAVWYLILIGLWTIMLAAIERRLSVSDRGPELSLRERLIAAWTPPAQWVRGGTR